MVNVKGQLVGKKALINGAGVGIGKAIALRFVQEGAEVAPPEIKTFLSANFIIVFPSLH